MIDALGGRKTPQLKPEMEMIVLAQKPREGTFVENYMTHGVGLIDTSDPLIDNDRFPGQVIKHPKASRVCGNLAVKPVGVLRHLIRIFSKPGDVVFDPFAGTGSTGIAAFMERRGFTGFERDPRVAQIANDQLIQHGDRTDDGGDAAVDIEQLSRLT